VELILKTAENFMEKNWDRKKIAIVVGFFK
jgi:hypothetical protein